MRKQGILENQAKTVYLGIGSNLGNKQHNIEIAKFKLQSYKIEIIKCSSNYETWCFDYNIWLDNAVGADFCVTNVDSW